jgi:plastocyanin
VRGAFVNSLCFLLLASAGVATFAAPATGRIEGAVTLNRRLAKGPMRFNLYPDAMDAPLAHAHHHAATDERQNVVVYLESVPSATLERTQASPAVIRQEEETFVPHILPVLKGTTVEFVNRDPLYHNVFSLSRATTFDLGRMPRDTSKSVRFERLGAVKVFCHIHSDMSAVVLVLENPFFTIVGSDGRYTLDGVPPGDYRAIAWHERAEPVIKNVHVVDGGVAALDFSVPVSEDRE